VSKTSSAHKVENMNDRLLQQMQTIVDFCEEHGHQPDRNNKLTAILKNIEHIVYMRRRNNIPVPKKLILLHAKIREFPTALEYKRKDLKFKNAAIKAEKELAFQKRLEKVQKLTPHNLAIFKFMYGDAKFTKFINTDIDPIVTKAFLDYFYTTYNSKKTSFSKRMAFFMMELYIGDYSDKDIEKLKHTLRCRTKEEMQIIHKIEHNQHLTQKEIGLLLGKSPNTVNEAIRREYRRFHSSAKPVENLLNLYMTGNASAVMSKLPPKFAYGYEYQRKMKLQDVPTDLLNKAGKVMIDFFTKRK